MTREELTQLVEGWMNFDSLCEALPDGAQDANDAWRDLLCDARKGEAGRKAYVECWPNNRWYIDVAHTVFAAIADDLDAEGEEA